VLLDGFIVLTQDQLNMLALGAEPTAPTNWMDPPLIYTGWPVLVAPEWPEKLELGSWVAFSMEGTLYAFQPEVIKANLERALMESTSQYFFPNPAVQDYAASVGLFQQSPSSQWWNGGLGSSS
jgi:hypothetical protein